MRDSKLFGKSDGSKSQQSSSKTKGNKNPSIHKDPSGVFILTDANF